VNCLMEQVAEQDAALVLVTHEVGLAAAVAYRHLSLEEAVLMA
jgi:ABC-type polar amino acid transport system ATPase subunit